MSYKVDMHLHTYYSDGSLSPTEIVKRAKGMEYDIIAITDHDTVDGIEEAMIAGNALEVKVVPGIELSAYTGEGSSVHVLGYYIDTKNQELLEELIKVRQNRERRNEKLLAALSGMGVDLTLQDLCVRPESGYIGKPVIARALVRKGYISHPKEAFEPGRFLESEEARAIKKEKLPVERALDLIAEAGGISVLAHPVKIKGLGQRGSEEFYGALDALVLELKKRGLKGLECYHRDHTHEESLALVAIAEKYKLHITEGSDYHGPEFE